MIGAFFERLYACISSNFDTDCSWMLSLNLYTHRRLLWKGKCWICVDETLKGGLLWNKNIKNDSKMITVIRTFPYSKRNCWVVRTIWCNNCTYPYPSLQQSGIFYWKLPWLWAVFPLPSYLLVVKVILPLYCISPRIYMLYQMGLHGVKYRKHLS